MRKRVALGWAAALAVLFAGWPGEQVAAEPQHPVVRSPEVIIIPQKGFSIRPCPVPSQSCQQGQQLIPKRGDYDYAGLRAALVKLRKRYQRLRALTLIPSAKERMGVVIKTIAHIRKTKDGKKLFPVVILALGSS